MPEDERQKASWRRTLENLRYGDQIHEMSDDGAKSAYDNDFPADRIRLTPLSVEYHANGFVETGGGELEEEAGKAVIAGGSAELKVNTAKNEEREKSECTISWPEQTLPIKASKSKNPEEEESSAASFSNEATPKPVSLKFPDGLQHTIVISNASKAIKFELEGEPCEEWGKEEGPKAAMEPTSVRSRRS